MIVGFKKKEKKYFKFIIFPTQLKLLMVINKKLLRVINPPTLGFEPRN
jgi:hypothetical protein